MMCACCSHLVANNLYGIICICILHFNENENTQGSITSSIIGFFSGMGDAAKEFGVPEGGCEGVSGFLFCVSLLFIVIIRSKTYAPDSPLVQLTFSKDGGSDGVNTEVRWSYCDLCISTLWKSNLLIYAVNLYSCYSALKGLSIHMLYLGEEVS